MLARLLLLAALATAASAAPAMGDEPKFCGWRSADDGRWSDERPEKVWMRASAKGLACSAARRLVTRSSGLEAHIEGSVWRCRTFDAASSEWSRAVRCVKRRNPDVVLRWKVLDQ
jgi:hypothetical protein